MFSYSQFKPAWWLSNAHGQTMLAKLLQHKPNVANIIETIELPDGDFVDLAWTEQPSASNNKPIVVVLHGLEGSKDSHYARGMIHAIKAKNWIGVVIHFRGCSGRPNRQAASYHSGDIRDITYFSSQLKKQYPNRALLLIGFSLGGNVLINYLANHPENPYKAACVICAPLDLASCSKKIDQGLSKIYQRYLLGMLKDSTLKKHQLTPLPNISKDTVQQLNTMWKFDDYITAPLNGFKDAADYYQQVSGIKLMHLVKTPCLCIHAADDPFLSHENIMACNNISSHVTFEISNKGGHVGFITGKNPLKPKFWLEERVPNYLEQFL